MATYNLKLPSMGESVMEATITKWHKQVGDTIQAQEIIVEVSTDKVDNEIPTEVGGTITQIHFPEDSELAIGTVLATIETSEPLPEHIQTETEQQQTSETTNSDQPIVTTTDHTKLNLKRYAPIVQTIAQQEQLLPEELETIKGTGVGDRVMKKDLLQYLQYKSVAQQTKPQKQQPTSEQQLDSLKKSGMSFELSDMGRTRKIIASRMKESLSTSAHVHSIIDVDVTNIVSWRQTHKEAFLEKTGQKITFTPIFFQAVCHALRKFPMLNASIVADDKIVIKKEINIGMATALPNGDLIVPVIKNADQLDLTAMATAVNDLAARAKNLKLNPEDTVNATYTVTNIGMFDNLIGAPIINQPQVGILAIGAIRKAPIVMEGPEGDYIGIRHMLYLTQSFDHRIVDGAIGGLFLKETKTYLENWNMDVTYCYNKHWLASIYTSLFAPKPVIIVTSIFQPN